MTVTTAPVPATAPALLRERLEHLRGERDLVLGESLLEATGDVADRATNVEATIRLRLLEERIAALELELAEGAHRQHRDGVVSVGDEVVLDFGDGPETYVVGSVEQAVAGIDTVTPGSPLGRALVGASVGASVTYEPRPGTTFTVRVVSAGVPLAASA
jgi:transcription elongation factor GreA